MTPIEKQHLAGFFDKLNNYLGNAGCNDYWIKVTPESRPMILAIAEMWDDEESRKHHLEEANNAKDGEYIGTYDWMVLHYLGAKLDLPKPLENIGERER